MFGIDDALGLLGIGGNLISSIFGGNKAAGAVNNGVAQGSQVLRDNFKDSLALLQPAINAGNTARGAQMDLLGLGGDPSKYLSLIKSQPGYNFGLNSGLGAIDTGRAGTGSFFSSGRDKDRFDYASGYAGGALTDYWNRLSGVSGAGANATGQAVGAGASTANNLADLAYRGGDATASSYLTAAKGVNTGIKDLLSLYYSR